MNVQFEEEYLSAYTVAAGMVCPNGQKLEAITLYGCADRVEAAPGVIWSTACASMSLTATAIYSNYYLGYFINVERITELLASAQAGMI